MSEPRPRRVVGVNDITGPGAARIKSIVAENRLKPKESDFKGNKDLKAGVYEKVGKDGKRTWGCKYTPNDGQGKLSKQSHAVLEMMRPSMLESLNRAQGPGEYCGKVKGKTLMIADANGTLWKQMPDGKWVAV